MQLFSLGKRIPVGLAVGALVNVVFIFVNRALPEASQFSGTEIGYFITLSTAAAQVAVVRFFGVTSLEKKKE